MLIMIPTMGRVDRQITYDHLPNQLRCCTFLICPPDETPKHTERGRKALSCFENGIAQTRDFIIRQAAFMTYDKVIMLDDDLTFLIRKTTDPADWHLRNATEGEIIDMMNWVWNNTNEEYPQVGVSVRQGNNNMKELTVVNTRCIRVYCYHVPTIQKENLRLTDFGDTTVMEDFAMTLHLLTRGYKNKVSAYWASSDVRSQMPGGCSQYRTAEVQKRSAEHLAKTFPGLVSVVQKKTKHAWEGMPRAEDGLVVRYDVMVQWKKAYAQSQRTPA